MIERKQPNRVVTIDGRGGAGDRITQTELASVSDLQAAAWAAEQNAQEAVLRIEGRLRLGATVEDGELIFDHGLRMVRRKKTG